MSDCFYANTQCDIYIRSWHLKKTNHNEQHVNNEAEWQMVEDVNTHGFLF